MPPQRPTAAQLRGAHPAFLVEVRWSGQVHRFAREPLVVSSDDGDVRYAGGLDLRGFSDTMKGAGSVEQGGTAVMAVTFERLSVAQAYIEANPLEGAAVELAMVFVRAGKVVTAYEDRQVQLTGIVTQPQFGFPDKPSGYFGFTVSARVFDDQTPILKGSWQVNNQTHPNANFSSVDGLLGAAYSLPFGSPGNNDIPGAPAYLVRTTSGDRRLKIGVGRMNASRVKLWDEDGVTYSGAPVSHDRDGLGQTYAYVLLTGAPGGFNNGGGKHYVSFFYIGNGGGLRNPFGRGYLSGGGDLLRYLYGRTPIPIDHPSWVSAAGILDRYAFSGHVNDSTGPGHQFCSAQLRPLLPIVLRRGAHGLYPVSLLPMTMLGRLPQVTLGPSHGIEQHSPVQVTKKLRDIVNQGALSYFYNARDERLTQSLVASTDASLTSRARFNESQRSTEIYGAREGKAVEASYVTDDSSAQHLLRWLLYDRGFLHMSVQVIAAPWWGWLMVGDQISLTADNLSLIGRRAVVTSKTWTGSTWRFVLSWSLAPIENNF